VEFLGGDLGAGEVQAAGLDAHRQDIPFADDVGGQATGDAGANLTRIDLAEGKAELQAERFVEFVLGQQPGPHQVFSQPHAVGLAGAGRFQFLLSQVVGADQDLLERALVREQGGAGGISVLGFHPDQRFAAPAGERVGV